MRLTENKIKQIMNEYKDVFDRLGHYDKTREKLWWRGRIDITLNRRIIKKLREINEKEKKTDFNDNWGSCC